MTNKDELKKKIREIIDSSCSFYYGSNVHMDDEQENAIADALISAGLTFDKTMAVLAERENCKTLIQKAQYYDQMKHRAEIAERALLTACVNLIKDKEDNVNMELLARVVYTNHLRKAEKELEEERKDE